MIELPDDELDKLFRKSSEELDPTYEPEDWNDLRKRLDQQDGKTPGAWLRKWWPLGALALLIPAGIMLYSWYGSKEAAVTANAGQSRVAVERSAEAKPGVASDKEAAGAPETAAAENATTENAENATAAEELKNTDTKKEISNTLKTSVKETGKSSSKSNAVSARNSAVLPRSRSKAGGVFLEPNRSTVEGGDGAFYINREKTVATRETDLPSAGPPEAERTLIPAAALNAKTLKWNALTLPGISQPVQELAEPPAPPKPSSLSADDAPLMAVRFGYSPDLSTVGLKDFSKPGTSVSLLVEYAVLPKLYVQSGVVWSRKDYYASAEAYQLPKIPHYYPPAMTGIDGVCKVLEVPLNLRYDLSSGMRSRWFVGGGLSSYHMNSEKYKYYFVNPNDPNAAKYPGWNGKTGWYWLSHANISAGYEYRVSRKLSLLAEPSIRLPLKRVGFGNVNLITTGLWLSVRYTPVFK